MPLGTARGVGAADAAFRGEFIEVHGCMANLLSFKAVFEFLQIQGFLKFKVDT
jgi:hypothetical protein